MHVNYNPSEGYDNYPLENSAILHHSDPTDFGRPSPVHLGDLLDRPLLHLQPAVSPHQVAFHVLLPHSQRQMESQAHTLQPPIQLQALSP